MWGNNNSVNDRKGFINDSMARNGACRQFIKNIARFDRLVLFTRPQMVFIIRNVIVNYTRMLPKVKIYDDILIVPTIRWEH